MASFAWFPWLGRAASSRFAEAARQARAGFHVPIISVFCLFQIHVVSIVCLFMVFIVLLLIMFIVLVLLHLHQNVAVSCTRMSCTDAHLAALLVNPCSCTGPNRDLNEAVRDLQIWAQGRPFVLVITACLQRFGGAVIY